ATHMYRDQRSPFSSVPVICIGTSSVPFIQVFEESNNFSAIYMRSHLLCIGDTTHTHTHTHTHTRTHTHTNNNLFPGKAFTMSPCPQILLCKWSSSPGEEVLITLVCVCVCLCERKTERERQCVYTHLYV